MGFHNCHWPWSFRPQVITFLIFDLHSIIIIHDKNAPICIFVDECFAIGRYLAKGVNNMVTDQDLDPQTYLSEFSSN
jgi:hypothetical protein